MNNFDRKQGPLQATNLRTVSLLAAIIFAAAAGISCNLTENASLNSGLAEGSIVAPVAGQANGDLHSTLPDLHDMRRRFRDRHWSSALVVETSHHQVRSSS